MSAAIVTFDLVALVDRLNRLEQENQCLRDEVASLRSVVTKIDVELTETAADAQDSCSLDAANELEARIGRIEEELGLAKEQS